MLTEDIYAQIFKKVIDREGYELGRVQNWFVVDRVIEDINYITRPFGHFQLSNDWPDSITYKEKIILHTKVIFKGTTFSIKRFDQAAKFYQKFKILANFERAFVTLNDGGMSSWFETKFGTAYVCSYTQQLQNSNRLPTYTIVPRPAEWTPRSEYGSNGWKHYKIGDFLRSKRRKRKN